ncbi:MAG: TonB-dependent receptor, partial [Acidobacteria bacterium]|nr:TonB-dependent receptor [Acidobacteriota bacterium]
RGDPGNDRALDDNDAHSVAFSYTKILRPTLLNEFRYGFIRQKVDKRELTDQLLGDLTAKYGIRGIPGNERLFGLPRFTLSGAVPYEGLGEPGSMPNFKIHQVHQYLDNVSWNRGSHNFKFGADLRWNRSDIFGGASSHGNFTFDGQFTGVSFADFLLGTPSSFSMTTLLVGQMRFRNYMFYAQDDWKVTPRVTLNLGVRYELTSPWWEKHDNLNKLEIDASKPDFNQIVPAGYCGDSWSCRALVNTDRNNWAPRLGLAWQVTQRSVLRAGAGVFYAGQGSLGANGRGINNFPFNRTAALQSTPARPALILKDGVPANFLGSATAPPRNANWIVWAENLPAPTIYQWNLAIQRELPGSMSLTAAYVGSSSNYLLDDYNWNGSAPGPPATEVQRRAIPQWNNINYFSAIGHASYHGLDLQVERRYASGLSFSAGYTWSHSIDNIPEQFGSGGGGIQDYRNFDGSRGNSNFDVRHRFVQGLVYELPFGKGRPVLDRGGVVNALFGGWQLSNLLTLQSGHYFTPTLANSRQRLGATGVGNWRPDVVRNPILDDPTADRWFDTSAFVLPRNPDGTFRFGNAGRALLVADGVFNLDAGLMKNFLVTERVNLQFRAEVFNITNTPTLSDPNSNFDTPDFGKVRGTVSTPRQMQFALRLSF